MNGTEATDIAEAWRGRGNTVGANVLPQQQLGRIDTSQAASEIMSYPPVQRSFTAQAKLANHSRQPSSATEKSSVHTQDSGVSNGAIGAPTFQYLYSDSVLSPPVFASASLSPAPSPTGHLPPPTAARKQQSISPQPIPFASPRSASQGPHASKPRNEASAKAFDVGVGGNTMADFALEDLFGDFVREADKKISTVSSSVMKSRLSDNIEDVCGAGVDAAFDKLLTSMGRVTREQPAVLVTKIGDWKVSHDKTAGNTIAGPGGASAHGVSRITEMSRINSERHGHPRHEPPGPSLPMSAPDEAMSERRASAASYLSCRAFIEILSQTTLKEFRQDNAYNLGELLFNLTVNQITHEDIKRSSLKHAKWEKSADVLGVLSQLDFGGVCGRYVAVLQEYQHALKDKGAFNAEVEGKAHMMLKGLCKLRPSGDQQTHFMVCSTWIGELIVLFRDAHGQDIKLRYCRMFDALFVRLAETMQNLKAGFEDSKWRRNLDLLQQRLAKLAEKPKYRDATFPAQVAMACVSPNDMFMTRWQSLPVTLNNRLVRERERDRDRERDRQHRSLVLKGACRLVWTYLWRNPGLNATGKATLDEIVKTIFFSRKSTLSRDSFITEPLVQLVRIIAHFNPEYAFKTIIFPLVHVDLFNVSSSRDPSYHSLDPDKIIIGIRAFLAILADVETSQQPSFPVAFRDDSEIVEDAVQTPMSPTVNGFKFQPRKGSLVRGERLSRPVPTQQLPPVVRESYDKFCELLGQILKVCDTAFGGQASVDEKFASTSTGRSFVDTWSFARRDDDEHRAERTGKYGFLDLLHVAVQAIPRCLSSQSSQTPMKNVVDLLCTGTAHTERDIAASSAISLKSIARQGFAEVIASRFAFFVFRYDIKYSTFADGGLLGPAHIQNTLKLWIELLNIWEEELLQRTKESASGGARLNASNSMAHVDHVEAQGLFLLCSPSTSVRSCAVEVLSIVTRLDKALGGSVARVYGILTGASANLFPSGIDSSGTDYSSIEKAKLEKSSRKSNIASAFVHLCSSTSSEDIALWYKLFPSFVQTSNQICPTSVIQAREQICNKLAHIQSQIDGLGEERLRAPTTGSIDSSTSRASLRTHVSPPHRLVEQYKLYLVFACATIQKLDSSVQSPTQEASHTRKESRPTGGGQEGFGSAQSLFSKIVPMVYNENRDVRQAAVAGMSSIHPNLYRLLLQSFDMQSRSIPSDSRSNNAHSRSASSPRRNETHPVFRQELVQIYDRTSHFLLDNDFWRDDWVMNHLSEFTWSLHEYLRQDDFYSETSSLRRHYCGLVQTFFNATIRSPTASRWMPFAKRKAHFIKIEDWFIEVTSFDSKAQLNGAHSPRGRQGYSARERVAAQENDRLKTTTSSAMATLCAGPFLATRLEPQEQFNVSRLLAWTDNLLGLEGDKPQVTGKRALINLISYNRQYPVITESIIAKLFTSRKSATTETYIDVLLDVFRQPDPPLIEEWRLIGALLFTLGDAESSIRMKSARLLRIFEEEKQCGSSLRSHDIGISDRTPSVNRAAHYAISEELLSHHRDSTFASCLFSAYAEHFIKLSPEFQRIMVLALLPWMRVIVLQKDRQTGYTVETYVVLLNLIYITMHCGTGLQNEVQALWRALLWEPLTGNARCILDFVIDLSLEKRDQKYLRTAKQIIVFLAGETQESTADVIEFFLNFIEPKSMNPTEPQFTVQKPSGAEDYPYVVDVAQVFPESVNPMRLSMGQLSLILLVDLAIADTFISVDKLPQLLQVILVLWDHHSQIVQEQAREMLVHLVHVLVISKADKTQVSGRTPSIEELVELIRRQDPKVGWAYNDSADPSGSDELPAAMHYVISEALALFSLTIPSIHEQWGAMALTWALQCPVKHIACRSLQIYRIILQPLGQFELSEILSRASTSVSDQAPEYQAFAVDVLRTIHAIVRSQPPESALLPRAFWAVCAALESVHEWEYAEALSTLSDLLEKCNLLDARVVGVLMANKPQGWECNILTSFVPFLHRGCSSRASHATALKLINRTMRIGCNPAFRDERCLRLGVLANLPRLLHSYDNPVDNASCVEAAAILADCCNMIGEMSLSKAFDAFANAKPAQDEFRSQCFRAMQQKLFVPLDYESTEFLMRQLMNPEPWVKLGTLPMIKVLLPLLDMDDPAITARGLDLFSPLVKLLKTEYYQDALNIIDKILPLAGVSNDLHRLRTAHAIGSSTRPSLKPAPDVGSLYGVPTDTGWAFLDPTTHNKRPRSRINAVAHYQFEHPDPSSRPTTLTPEVEFQKDELYQDSYFPNITETIVEVPSSAWYETNISQLTAQLDDLDEFFEDNASETAVESEHSAYSTTGISRKDHPRPLHQSKPPIPVPTTPRSHRKLDSTASFTGDFPSVSLNVSPALPAQAFPSHPLPPMSPSAFASAPSSDQRPSTRPGMGPRAATMPVSNLQTTPPDKAIPKASVEAENFSDDDLAGGESYLDRADSGVASRDVTPQKPFSALRNSIKRLAGDRHRRTNTRAQPGASPQVPPVPNEYLPMPQSSEI